MKPRTSSTSATSAKRQTEAPAGLSDALLERTRSLHARAERCGIVQEILRGRASYDGYALLLRNLLPAYEQLEAGLCRHRCTPKMSGIARRELFRAPALRSDLQALYGPRFDSALPLLQAGEDYAHCVATAALHDGMRLIGHAYTRYLGDLSGGQIIKRLLARSLELRPEQLSFYDFPDIADPDAFKIEYRRTLDTAGANIADINSVLEEAALAFELNIKVSEAVGDAALQRADAAALHRGSDD